MNMEDVSRCRWLFYRAWVDTRHWSIEAYGDTKEAALDGIREVWDDWRKRTGATITTDELLEDTSVMEIREGVYWDGEHVNMGSFAIVQSNQIKEPTMSVEQLKEWISNLDRQLRHESRQNSIYSYELHEWLHEAVEKQDTKIVERVNEILEKI